MGYTFNNFYELIEFQGNKRKNKIALLVDDTKITYGDILEHADKLAAYLRDKGENEGDKVALFLRNSPEFIYSIFAVAKLGAILVPINTFLKEEELSYILENSESTFLIASMIHKQVVDKSLASTLCRDILWEGEVEEGLKLHFNEVAEENNTVDAIEKGLDDIAVLIYTSGTTGKPKGAMLSNKIYFQMQIQDEEPLM